MGLEGVRSRPGFESCAGREAAMLEKAAGAGAHPGAKGGKIVPSSRQGATAALGAQFCVHSLQGRLSGERWATRAVLCYNGLWPGETSGAAVGPAKL